MTPGQEQEPRHLSHKADPWTREIEHKERWITKEGMKQAREAGKKLAQVKKFDLIITSTAMVAQQTAKYVREQLPNKEKVEIRTDSRVWKAAWDEDEEPMRELIRDYEKRGGEILVVGHKKAFQMVAIIPELDDCCSICLRFA